MASRRRNQRTSDVCKHAIILVVVVRTMAVHVVQSCANNTTHTQSLCVCNCVRTPNAAHKRDNTHTMRKRAAQEQREKKKAAAAPTTRRSSLLWQSNHTVALDDKHYRRGSLAPENNEPVHEIISLILPTVEPMKGKEGAS